MSGETWTLRFARCQCSPALAVKPPAPTNIPSRARVWRRRVSRALRCQGLAYPRYLVLFTSSRHSSALLIAEQNTRVHFHVCHCRKIPFWRHRGISWESLWETCWLETALLILGYNTSSSVTLSVQGAGLNRSPVIHWLSSLQHPNPMSKC